VKDPRVERFAELLVGYSLELREGDVVRLDGGVCAAPLLLALYETSLLYGARPYVDARLTGLTELLLDEGSEDQIAFVSPVERREVEALDALVTVWADENTRELSSADPDRLSRHIGARHELRRRRWERISAGDLRWAGTAFPTNAMAQDAEMSLAEYERFVFSACHVEDDGDAAAYWRSTAAELAARTRELAPMTELRVVGPDTDLRLGVSGRPWIAADGHFNMPDGEVFTSPVETATEGEIRFQFPAIYEGREVEDVRLRFEAGSVVEAEAGSGEDYLRALLATDGASVLGEVAFGLNYEIDRFTRNILFDEKIGGTMHFALGSGFAQAGGENQSSVHWDMICDLRTEGEVYADGELLWQAGRFLRDTETHG
jgi:aminopeptidase